VKKLCTVLLFFCFACLLLSAEEIHLKDGTKLTGQITGVTADKFQVKTAYGDIQVPKTEIVSINFPENEPKEEKEAASANAVPEIDQSLENGTYLNRTENIQMTIPSGWVLAPEFNGKDIHGGLKSADETQFVFITPEKFSGSVQTYAVVVETQLQNKFKDFEKIAQFDTTLDGHPAIRMLFKARNQNVNNMPLKFLVYMVSYDNKVVRLSFGTLEPLFDKALPDFEKIAASYKTVSATSK
jgi:hypothetical protein